MKKKTFIQIYWLKRILKVIMVILNGIYIKTKNISDVLRIAITLNLLKFVLTWYMIYTNKSTYKEIWSRSMNVQ